MLYSASYFSCSALATTLGLAEPLNYGLSMPPGWLRREWGMMRHAAVSQWAGGHRLIVDRWDATPSPCSLALQTVGDFT